jgi:hypothetical protein
MHFHQIRQRPEGIGLVVEAFANFVGEYRCMALPAAAAS